MCFKALPPLMLAMFGVWNSIQRQKLSEDVGVPSAYRSRGMDDQASIGNLVTISRRSRSDASTFSRFDARLNFCTASSNERSGGRVVPGRMSARSALGYFV